MPTANLSACHWRLISNPMKVKAFLLSIITIAVLSSCAKDIVDLTGSITGTVKDYDNGQLISNCQVSMSPGGKSLTTGSDGQFEFESVEPGSYTLSFKKSGYEDASSNVSVVAGKTQNVQLTLKVLSAVISVSETKLDFGSTTATLSFTVSNTGKGNLEWSLSDNIDWLSCSPTSGMVLPSKSETIVATVNRTGKDTGNYSDNIVVSSNVGNATIAVSMSVTPVELTLSPSSLDFGSAESTLGVSMTNPSGKTLKYGITTTNDWLSVSKSSGSITTTDSFNAIVSRSGLSAGDYDGNIIIKVEGTEFSIPVKMKVARKEKPSVSIEEVNSITAYGATVKATVKSVGSSKVTRYGVCWSKNSTPTVDDYISNLGDCTGAKSYESTISELDSETKYYVRAYAENAEGLAYSDRTLSFTTSAKPTIPAVSTISADNVTTTSATATGRITSLGNVAEITEHGHVWATSPQPTVSSCAHTSLGKATSAREFSSDVTGLSAGTKYYIRAYATNSEGTAYGDDVTFTTKDYEAPSVSIGKVSDIQKNSFSISGEIKSTGGIELSDYGHCWSTSQNPTTSDSRTSLGSRSAEGSFSSDVTNLAEGTTYYVRAYAVNSKGTSYSDQIEVTTAEGSTDKWDGSKASSFAGGSGTSADPYRIETGAQFVLIKDYDNKYFILKNNIDLDNRSWPSISFSGVLNGDGHVISNLKVSRSDGNAGLFSSLSGTVKKLTVKGVDIQASSSSNVGAIAGSLSGAITDCSVSLNQQSKILGSSGVGGIAGSLADGGSVSACKVTSTSSENVISGAEYVGGIVGYVNHSYSNRYIERCHVDANIYGGSCTGGICGALEPNTYTSHIKECSYKGTISGESRIGGIFGGSSSSIGEDTFYILGCKADVTINVSEDIAGGIYGYALGKIRVLGCYVTGTLNCEKNNARDLGGISGATDSSSDYQAELCYSTMVSSHSNFGGLSGHDSTLRGIYAKDCASVVSSKGYEFVNCNTSCTDITDFLRSCYSSYAEYYDFDSTWTWTGKVNGTKTNVSCPKLSWE